MSSQGTLRKRGGKRDVSSPALAFQSSASRPGQVVTKKTSSEWDYKIAIVVMTLLAFATRFYKISYPEEVVFDEVHFGKFASYYLQRTYFFDVHPPFGKLLYAAVGWLVGYDGHYLFDNIGEPYIENRVPYVALRALPAILGTLTVPVVFLTMWESGYSVPACVLASGLIVFDNAHIAETRLILLDACLVLSMALSILCYVKFYKERYTPFGRKWWKWLLLTGVSLSCVISTKYVGVFTFVTIGSAVCIDLWNLLDVNRRGGTLSLQHFGRHFAARAVSLIIIPFFFYLFWFQVHFTVLTRSGPGDDFMTPEFQETLADNLMAASATEIHYYDSITINHKDTKTFLHSHFERYPLRYDDGRISSQGQQVTGYPYNDTNNNWQILPRTPFPDGSLEGHPVVNGDVVQLYHIGTNSVLLTHDVASPYFPTNQEFTTVSPEDAAGDRRNDTLFEIRIENGKDDQVFKTKSGLFKLVHFPSRVAMWTHTTPLPDWAFKQAEINGNKNSQQSSNIWFVDDIPSLPENHPRRERPVKEVKSLSFMRKWAELQRAMFFHNNALTSEHPYASEPFQWPFLLRGVSFWTKNDTREQIYFLGNPIGWWICSSLLAVFVGIVGADQLSLRRGFDNVEDIWGPGARARLYNSTGFLFLCWAAHYFPFWLMGRQRFLHHYLPSHLASTLVAGALIEFIFNLEPITPASPANNSSNNNNNNEHTVDSTAVSSGKSKENDPAVNSEIGPASPSEPENQYHFVTAKERMGPRSYMAIWAATIVILSATIYGFLFFAPLTYGTPGLDVDGVMARKWLSYDLHFAK